VIEEKDAFIIDMDGVIYHGSRLLEGAKEFVEWLRRTGKKFLFLTNSSQRSPRELSQKLARLGIEVDEDHFYTSALATAAFLKSQSPQGSCFVIGDTGLTNALYDAGLTMNEVNPDYVVVGESHNYTYARIQEAVHLVLKGAKLIGTNPDVTGPSEEGIVPATGALMAPIKLATGREPYFVGKPNPLMMRHAMRTLGADHEETAIVGDRMDTDIVAGTEAEIETILVLSGVTDETELRRYAYQPDHVLQSVGDIVRMAEDENGD
jgi:NagD protein